MINVLAKAFLVLMISGAPFAAFAEQWRVSQESAPGASDFDDNVVGYIEAFEAKDTTAGDFYSYSSASFQGPVPVDAGSADLFMVRTKEGNSLFMVYSRYSGGQRGSASASVETINDQDGFDLLLSDDPGEATGWSGVSSLVTSHSWVGCCSDGFVVGSIDQPGYALVSLASYQLASLQAISAEGSKLPLKLQPGRRVRIDEGVKEVSLDVKPGSCPNPLNASKRGVTPVAVPGDSDLDVRDIDMASVQLEGVSPRRWHLD